MKTLAIFGDSYGHEYDKKHKTWVDFLRESYIVSNFCISASSMWFSYSNFIKNHTNYDKIIFLVTSPWRMQLPKNTTFKTREHMLHSLLDYYYNIELNNEIKKEYEILMQYLKNICDLEKEKSHHDLMIVDIKNTRPDCILYPCFNDSMNNFKGLTLYQVTKYEDKLAGFTLNASELLRAGYRDIRMCHMTEKNHIVIANMFLEGLNNREIKLETADLTTYITPEMIYQKINT